MPASLRSATFVASIGVNIHLPILNSPTNTSATLSALSYLGIGTVRSPIGGALLQSGSIASRLADAGIHFDALLGGYKTPAENIAALTSFARAHGGAITAIEGPNEINNWPITFNGLTGAQAGVAFVNAAAAAAKETQELANAHFYDLTGAPTTDTATDASGFTNIHVYPNAGNQPYSQPPATIMSLARAWC